MGDQGSIKFLVILIMIGILLPFFSAFALIGDIADIGSCALRNRLKQFLKDVLSPIVNAIKSAIKAAICAGLGLFGIPCPKSDIQKVAESGLIGAKETIEDTISRCIARQALTRMTRGMLQIVREGGRDGGPTYIQNWRDFTLQSQYRGENIWRGLLYVAANGEGSIPPLLCKHIRQSQAFNSLQPTPVPGLLQSLGPNRRINSLEEYLVATKCDPVVDANFDTFMKDFSAGGGWDTFERMLQPQNNIFGATGLALAELEKQRSLEEKIAANEAVAGRGFLGIRGDGASDSCLVTDRIGRCVVYKNVKTPGYVISEAAVENAFRSELNWVVSVDEINELLTDMFDVVVARLKNLGANDTATPPIELPDVGGSINFVPDPADVCVESCISAYCTLTQGGYDCSLTGSELNACTAVCYEPPPPPGGGGGGGGGNPPPPPLPPLPGSGAGSGNDPGAPSSVNLSNVTWLDSDVSGWAQTANLSVRVTGGGSGIDLNYDKTSVWPAGFPLDSVTALNANAWIFVYRNGNWVASTWEWMKPGQTSKGTSNLYAPGNALRGELSNSAARPFAPRSGDTYGFMVSCLARSSTRNCTERSNVVMVTWPGGSSGNNSSQPTSLLSNLQTERAKYGTPPNPSEVGAILNTVAWNNRGAGWGLNRKTGGHRCPSPAGEIACDILHHQPTNIIVDVFIASETTANPTWNAQTPMLAGRG